MTGAVIWGLVAQDRIFLNIRQRIVAQGIHRVTAVRGARARIVALLGYDTRQGVVSSEHLHYLRYGRVPA